MSTRTVKITAADWNGHTFDGSPFDAMPAWLVGALIRGLIAPVSDGRDYLLWAVAGSVGCGEPGDIIENLGGGEVRLVRKDRGGAA